MIPQRFGWFPNLRVETCFETCNGCAGNQQTSAECPYKVEISGIAGLISTLLCWIIFSHCLSHYTDLICLILDLDIRSLLLAIAPPFVAGFVQVNRTHASAVNPSVQNLYHAALAENLVDSSWSLSSLEPTAGSSTPGQHQRYDNTGGSNNSRELEVSRGIFASIWRHSANSLTMGTSGLKTAKTSTIHAPSKPKNSRTIRTELQQSSLLGLTKLQLATRLLLQ